MRKGCQLLLLLCGILATCKNHLAAQEFSIVNIPRYWLDGIPAQTGNGNYPDRDGSQKTLLTGWFEWGASYNETTSTIAGYNGVFGPVNTLRVHINNVKAVYSELLPLHTDTLLPKRYLVFLSCNKPPLPESLDISPRDYWEYWDTVTTTSYDDEVYKLLIPKIRLLDSLFRDLPGGVERAIAGWYTHDEPKPVWNSIPPKWFYQYNAQIRRAEETVWSGLHLPVFCTLNRFDYIKGDGDPYDNLVRYASDPNVDVINLDKYPFYDQKHTPCGRDVYFPEARFYCVEEDSCLYAYTSDCRWLAHDINRARVQMEKWSAQATSGSNWRKPIIAMPQGSAHKNGGMFTTHDGVVKSTTWHRLPSYAELRHQLYTALAAGASGFLPWGAHVCYHPNPPEVNWGDQPHINFWKIPDAHVVEDAASTRYFLPSGCEYQPNFWLAATGDSLLADSLYEREEAAMFGNYRLLYEELESLAPMLIGGKYLDNYVSWEITRVSGNKTPIQVDDLRTMSFRYEKACYLIVANNCRSNAGLEHIPPLEARFKIYGSADWVFASGLLPDRVWEIDPWCYETEASYPDLTRQEPRRITLRSFNGGSYFEDAFQPGEVHIYRLTY